MLIAKVINGVVEAVAHHGLLFPNVSFAAPGPSDAFLAANQCMRVDAAIPFDPLTHMMASTDPYVSGDKVYLVHKIPLSADAIAAAKAGALGELRRTRNALLAACDWTQLLDAPVANAGAWAVYRQSLRDFPATVADARLPYSFPTPPGG